MNVRLWKSVVLVGLLLTSVYAPLRAMQDSAVVRKKVAARIISSFTLKTIPTRLETEFGEYVSRNFRGDIPTIGFPSLALAPIHLIGSNIDNPWINELSYSFYYYKADSREMTYSCFAHEVQWGFGYAVVDSPRFRLYPMLSAKVAFDVLAFTKQTSLASLVSTFESPSIFLQRTAPIAEIAVGADYRIPTEIDNYDIYVLAKVGYNLIISDAPWTHDSRRVNDMNPAWL